MQGSHRGESGPPRPAAAGPGIVSLIRSGSETRKIVKVCELSNNGKLSQKSLDRRHKTTEKKASDRLQPFTNGLNLEKRLMLF